MDAARPSGVSCLLAAAMVVCVLGVTASQGLASQREIHVPGDAATLQAAIVQAQPGDTIVLEAGTYPGGNVIPSAKHDLTIRGVDRNQVVLDGADQRKNGIVVHAEGVAILNMSAHNFLDNGFYWQDADRFRASYLTAWNIRGYGIYAEDSSEGMVDHDYVSGAGDAAYYVGECRPCRATISNVVATLSAVGYSGTNASGVVIRDSLWDRNGAGILPNTYANEALPPQTAATVVGNTVTGSGRARVPIHTPLAGFIGIGIAIAGGNRNSIRDNSVTASERYGIAVFPTARFVVFSAAGARDPGPPWRPRDNRIAANTVSGSDWADLALAAGSGKRNCFTANSVGETLPHELQTAVCSGVSATGDPGVASVLTRRIRSMVSDAVTRRRPPPYTSMPTPPAQPTMP